MCFQIHQIRMCAKVWLCGDITWLLLKLSLQTTGEQTKQNYAQLRYFTVGAAVGLQLRQLGY
jgi:hypothetical protein